MRGFILGFFIRVIRVIRRGRGLLIRIRMLGFRIIRALGVRAIRRRTTRGIALMLVTIIRFRTCSPDSTAHCCYPLLPHRAATLEPHLRAIPVRYWKDSPE